MVSLGYRLLSVAKCQSAFATFADCDFEADAQPGPYGPAKFFNITYDKTVIYGLVPEGEGPFPLLGYMHGANIAAFHRSYRFVARKNSNRRIKGDG